MNGRIQLVTILLSIILVGLSAYMFMTGNTLGALQSVGFLAAIELLSVLLKDKMPAKLKPFLIVCSLYNAIGWMGNYYQTVWFFDDIAHFTTAVTVTALLGHWYLLSGGGKQKDPWIDVLIIASMGIAVGTMWEICEWYAFQMLPIPPITIQDTISDLVNDSIGALIAGAALMYNLLRIYNRNLTLRK